jgi:hypothetical protein
VKISTTVTITGKPDSGNYTSEAPIISHQRSIEIPELGATSADEFTPEHVEQLCDRVADELKDATRRLKADLDVLAAQADTRTEAARKKARDEAKGAEHELSDSF